MTFTPGIPQSGQSLGNSRTQIVDNFTNYNDTMSQDHVAPNATGQGKHKLSTYVEQAADPATLANELAMYCKDLAGISSLFLRKESSGTVIQLSGQDPVLASPGSTILAGGVYIKWGTGNSNEGPAAPANFTTFTTAFPNNCWTVVLVASDLNYSGTHVPYNLAVNGFNGRRTSGSGNTGFYYIAIGN